MPDQVPCKHLHIGPGINCILGCPTSLHTAADSVKMSRHITEQSRTVPQAWIIHTNCVYYPHRRG